MNKLFAVALLILIVFLFLLFPCTLASQDLPKAEIFGGYSLFRLPSYVNQGAGSFITEKANLNGWNVTATGNLNRWLGAEADFGGYYGTVKTLGPGTPYNSYKTSSIRMHSFLFGPRLSFRLDRFTPFFHALLGPVVLSQGQQALPSRSDFSLALGGGFDVAVAKHLAIRGIQADRVWNDSFNYGILQTGHGLRLSFGGVLRF